VSALNRWINRQIGLVVTPEFETNVNHELSQLAKNMAIPVEQLVRGLISDTLDPRAFIEKIVTNESFFYRYPEQMDYAAQHIIKPLVNSGKRARILSMPCSCGEEPYTFAMVLRAHGVNLNRVSITAMDVSQRCITHAKRGVYDQYAFRRTSEFSRQQYFRPTENGRFQVTPEIQQNVQFVCINLFDGFEDYAQQFDLIFFNNLLIYLDEIHVARAMKLLKQKLTPQGWLVVDSTEAPRCRQFFSGQPMGSYVGFRHTEAVTQAKQKNTNKPEAFNNNTANKSAQFKTISPKKQPPLPENKKLLAKSKLQNKVIKDTKKENQDNPKDSLSEHNLLQQALQAIENKHFDNAIALYKQLIEQNPSQRLTGLVGLCQLCADQGDDIQAMDLAEQAIKHVPHPLLSDSDRANLHAVLALCLHARGLNVAAACEFEEVEKLNPKHPALKLKLGGK
jgi:chemotaxis methyl-accepting protein methylase